MFIVFEGINGSGKSTIIKALSEKLGQKCIIASDQYSNKESIKFSKQAKKPIFDFFESAVFYYLARRKSLKNISFDDEKIILYDRFSPSTFANQLGLTIDETDKMDKIFLNDLKKPDLYIYIKTKPEVAFDRQKSRGKIKNKIGMLELISLRYDEYFCWKHPQMNLLIIENNEKDKIDEIVEKICEKITNLY